MAKIENAKKQVNKKVNSTKKNTDKVTKKVKEEVTKINEDIKIEIEEVEDSVEKVVVERENKNKKLFTILGVVIAIMIFLGLSFLIDPSGKENENTNSNGTTANIESWYNKSTNGDEIVTVIASSQCPHCQEYKPVIEKLASDKGFELYFFEADYLEEVDYTMLTGTFELSNFSGAVPYTFIVKDGKFVADTVGYLDEDTTINFLKENNIIE